MRKDIRWLALAALLLAAAPVAWAATAPPDMESALLQAAATVCNPPAGCAVSEFQRAEAAPGIAYYTAIVQVGPGVHDRVKLHRVTAESRPGYPQNGRSRVFLITAENVVESAFFFGRVSDGTPDDFGLAIYLAQNGIDVWAMDPRNVLFPADSPDLDAMLHWGMQTNIDDTRAGLAIARETRRLINRSEDRFNLAGYLLGGSVAVAVANEEATLPKQERHVQGIVSLDIPVKTETAWLRDMVCFFADIYRELTDLGVPAFENYSYANLPAQLARTDPDGPSPVLPGLTNLQAALQIAGAEAYGPGSVMHFFAPGAFDEDGLVTDLRYTPVPRTLDVLDTLLPYWTPVLVYTDWLELVCDAVDSPFDDHLHEVTIPYFSLQAAGGWGPYDDTELWLGSRDVSEYRVSFFPPEDILLDFGFMDWTAAPIAPEVAWPPLLQWLQDHR